MVKTSNQIGLYLAIPLYLGVMGLAALKAWRAGQRRAAAAVARDGVLTVDGEMSSHFLGGRSFGVFVTTMTLFASLFSGYTVIGIPNEAYTRGWYAARWLPAEVLAVLGLPDSTPPPPLPPYRYPSTATALPLAPYYPLPLPLYPWPPTTALPTPTTNPPYRELPPPPPYPPHPPPPPTLSGTRLHEHGLAAAAGVARTESPEPRRLYHRPVQVSALEVHYRRPPSLPRVDLLDSSGGWA